MRSRQGIEFLGQCPSELVANRIVDRARLLLHTDRQVLRRLGEYAEPQTANSNNVVSHEDTVNDRIESQTDEDCRYVRGLFAHSTRGQNTQDDPLEIEIHPK